MTDQPEEPKKTVGELPVTETPPMRRVRPVLAFLAGFGLTTSGNTLTGAIFNLQTDWAKAPNFQLNIGPSGDGFGYLVAEGNCSVGGVYTATYVGAVANSPCTVNVSNSTAGVWNVTSAPEVDPSSTASALSLLIGGLCVLRGSRKVVAQASSRLT
jgi:hypothetical protein